MSVATEEAPPPMRFLRPKDCAQLLGVSVPTLGRWRVDGTGPRFFKAGPQVVLYSIADVTEWLEARARTSTAA